MQWIKEVNGYIDLLDEEYRLIADEIGVDNLLKLVDLFDKNRIYISKERFDAVRRAYIAQATDKSVKELVKILGVSETYVYETLRRERPVVANQTKMEL